MTIALVDCNSFFCSCERLFRPDLKNRPVVVLSNNDGCAIARTKEAKELGIEMAAPYFKIKDLCRLHDVAIFSSNFSIYTNLSCRVMEILKEMTPCLEVYSIDEAWMDLTGVDDPFHYAQQIKNRVERLVGIPVSIGIGPTKTLTKVANHIAKKLEIGVVDLTEKSEQDKALKEISIGKVWGIGRRGAFKMRSLGIKTAKDLRDYANGELIKKMFGKPGWQTKRELSAEACFKLELVAAPKKEIMCSRTFAGTLQKLEELQGAIASFVSNAAQDLRSQESICAEIGIFIITNRFDDQSFYRAQDSFQFLSATIDTRKLIKASFKILEKIYRPGYQYKKAGVYLSRLYSRQEYQLHLFENGDGAKNEQLMKIMDRINFKEGPNTIHSAACDIGVWHMNRNFKSPRYLSSWSELPKVR